MDGWTMPDEAVMAAFISAISSSAKIYSYSSSICLLMLQFDAAFEIAVEVDAGVEVEVIALMLFWCRRLRSK